MARQAKFVFVTGGVLSGLGKGITAASIGNLLKSRGLKVNIQKCDPYLNVDAGMLNPREHGECFVTCDGAETDLDLGHYERFLDQEIRRSSSLMSGRVLLKVIEDERSGQYDGNTVQIIPHVTKVISDFIKQAAAGYDVHIVEIGGTVGDYESLSFLEAIREMGLRLGSENCAYVHVVYLPYLEASQEIKTKPAQNSVRELRGLGIAPNILVARSETATKDSIKAKLSLFSGVSQSAIALLPNAKSIYQVPLSLQQAGIDAAICAQLKLKTASPKLKAWQTTVERSLTNFSRQIKVGIVAKYMDNQDTYMSVLEALKSAAWWHNINLTIIWIDAEKLEHKSSSKIDATLGEVDGLIVPGGFGPRGVEGKIIAAKYALNNNQPYLGLCLGLQVAVIAAARLNGLANANSTEFKPKNRQPVIATMEAQKGKENTGGTMRLGNYKCQLISGSQAQKLYAKNEIVERHRHRYECNSYYLKDYSKWGLKIAGTNPRTGLVEIIEAANHPFFVASQFHPEFTSRPNRPHPLFTGFVSALLQNKRD
ncbi:MAG: CTP synthase [Candidatus Saccharimonadales bacterium]